MDVQTLTVSTLQGQETPAEARVLLAGVSWQTFKALLADIGDNRACRLAYDQGMLEIMAPYEQHEEPKVLIAGFVEAIADELRIEVRHLGSLTLEREDLRRAVEPDTCFYIQNESLVRGKKIDLANDPPPDLVVEIDYTSRSLNKFEIYSSLGVSEFWRYENQQLYVYQLTDKKYNLCDQSLAFPFLPIANIPDLYRAK
ncbi:MAG: Uma2 family endonuclease [Gloeocapsa sp. UFS-A4-WI-NPMV-4B04]|jgi:Uma2 family endonuclease|nr:Uma2 family endonuclease [Gloeocapsa sp. UFS-A4-WI-NPMV-4B04]